MIDRNLEKKIKDTKEFIELWRKFHNLYKSALEKASISPEEEDAFLETKSLIARRYQALTDSLKLSLAREDRTFDVISQVLSLKSVSSISDVQMRSIEGDWHKSYITLNKILGGLENKRGELAKINPFVVAIRKVFSEGTGNKLVKLALLIALIVVFLYLIRVRGFGEPIKELLNSFLVKCGF